MRRLMIAGVLVAGCAESPAPLGPHALYQMTRQEIATVPQEYAPPTNGGLPPENVLGNALLGLASEQLADPQAATDQTFGHGDAAFVLDVQHSPTGEAAVNSYRGGADAYDPGSPAQAALSGTRDGKLVSAGPGDFAIVLAPFGVPLTTTLHRARVQLFATADATTAVVSGAVEMSFLHDSLFPGWANTLAGIIQRDCSTRTPPGCGCTDGSPGARAIANLDANRDCVVDAAELESSYLAQSFAVSDVTVEGQPMMTFGFGLDGVAAGVR